MKAVNRLRFKQTVSLVYVTGALLIWLATISSINAQAPDGRSSDRTAEKAEDLYNDLGYKAAVPLLESERELSLKQMTQLANAYRLNHDTKNAEKWYAQVVASDNAEPKHLLYYAQALQSNGRIEKSTEFYRLFEAATGGDDERGRLGLAAIQTGVKHNDVQIRNERQANTDHLDFSPTYYRDGVVFVTTRKQRGLRHRLRDLWINDNFMSLAYADANPETGELGKAEEFAPELNTKFHEGPLCFTTDGTKVYFTRNTYNKRKRRDSRDGVMKLNLYSSSLDTEGEWTEPVELPFNTDDYEEAHPAVSPDEQFLFFASDRPGGYGGMDIYVSRFSGGVWGMPDNLGPAINTPGNEAFPVVHDNGMLYFASDGLGGLGGMDIFVTDIRALRGDGDVSVGVPENIGRPFNSEKDDFGFVANEDLTAGYLTSARGGGASKDDIYSFSRPKSAEDKQTVTQVLCVYEQPDNGKRIEGATIAVTPILDEAVSENEDNDLIVKLRRAANSDEYVLTFADQRTKRIQNAKHIQMLTSGVDGTSTFDAIKGMRYAVEVTYPGFETFSYEFVANMSEALDAEHCVGLQTSANLDRSQVSLVGVTRNKRYNNILPNVDLKLINLCTGEEQTTRSGADGNYSFGCVPCGCEYVIQGEKEHFINVEALGSTMGIDCEKVPCEKGGLVSVDIQLIPEVSGRNAIAQEPITGASNFAVARAPYELGGGKLVAGTMIELKNIYYDFDQSYIRDDARGDLDHIAALMLSFPGMIIELGSHTDARGRASYNKSLSQARAEAARVYLMRQGIDNRRIVAKGYGEQQLRNRCSDYVECSEFDHQVNRRTEVKIISMGNSEVEVRYVNDRPQKVDAANPSRVFVWK